MGIVQAVRKAVTRSSADQDFFADWTKRLFDAQGNEIELKEFAKLHWNCAGDRWLKKQFKSSGLYWLLYSSPDGNDAGILLLRVTVGRKNGTIAYIVRDFTTVEETLHMYEAYTNVNNCPLRIPPIVRETALSVIPDRV